MRRLALRLAAIVVASFPFVATAQTTQPELDANDPWDGRTPQVPLDLLDPWDDSKPAVEHRNAPLDVVEPWRGRRTNKQPARELSLLDPWKDYPKRKRLIPKRELSLVDPWGPDESDVPTATFPLVGEAAGDATPAAPALPRKPTLPRAPSRPVPTASFPLVPNH